MTLRHLEIFRAVCAHESITLAAEKLYVTQPTVSIAIRELESFYQTKLFDRMNRRIYLTDAGAALLQYADSILDRFDESIEALRHPDAPGKLRLGVNATVGETQLSSILAALKDGDPAPEVRVVVDNSAATEASLSRNEIDLAIIDEVSQPERWQASILFSEEMVVVGAPDRFGEGASICVSDLARENLLLREKGSGSRRCVEAVFLRHGVTAVPAVESGSTMTLLALAESGIGLTILPRSLAEAAQDRVSIAGLADDRFFRRFYLLQHPQKYLSPSLAAALARLRRRFDA